MGECEGIVADGRGMFQGWRKEKREKRREGIAEGTYSIVLETGQCEILANRCALKVLDF
jgi:hypothetical protein